MRKLNDKKSSGQNSGRFGARDSSRFTSNRKLDRFGRTKRSRDSSRSRGSSRSRDSSRRSPIEMHKAICDKCGAECEVPFKPTAGKPVLCSDCFKKQGNKRGNNELGTINEKLDKIMKALKIE